MTDHDVAPQGNRPRFSIRAVMILMAVVALAVWPIPWLGRLYVANLLSTALLLGALAFALYRRSTILSVVFCVISFFLPLVQIVGGAFLSPVEFLSVVGLPLLLIATHGFLERPGLRLALCGCLVACVYAWGFWEAAQNHAVLTELAEEYPLVSLVGRVPTPKESMLTPITLTRQQSENLDLQERQTRWGHRSHSLEMLHSTWYRQFAAANGFGVSRMPSLLHRDADFFVAEPAPLKQLPEVWQTRSNQPYEALLGAGRSRFLHEDRMGYFDTIDKVAGFQPHAFIKADDWDSNEISDQSKEQRSYRIENLSLIGLIAHDRPVAYVSDHLPNMEELVDAPTRELDDFEREALKKLRGASDLEVSEKLNGEGGHIRMLGALRAGENCAACHGVPRGVLLGAFSYQLVQLD